MSAVVRQFIVWLDKRDGCFLCGTTDRPLQQHHAVPSLKRYDISDIAHGAIYVPFDVFLDELQKTFPLCAKCHTSVHTGVWWLIDCDVSQVERFEVLRVLVQKQRVAA